MGFIYSPTSVTTNPTTFKSNVGSTNLLLDIDEYPFDDAATFIYGPAGTFPQSISVVLTAPSNFCPPQVQRGYYSSNWPVGGDFLKNVAIRAAVANASGNINGADIRVEQLWNSSNSSSSFNYIGDRFATTAWGPASGFGGIGYTGFTFDQLYYNWTRTNPPYYNVYVTVTGTAQSGSGAATGLALSGVYAESKDPNRVHIFM